MPNEPLLRYADRIEKAYPYLRNSTVDAFHKQIVADMREEASREPQASVEAKGWMIEFTPMAKPLWFTGELHENKLDDISYNLSDAARKARRRYIEEKNLWGKKSYTLWFTDDPCAAAIYLTQEAAQKVLDSLHAAGELMGKDCYRITEHEWPAASPSQPTQPASNYEQQAIDDMCPNCCSPWKCNGPHESVAAEAQAGRWKVSVTFPNRAEAEEFIEDNETEEEFTLEPAQPSQGQVVRVTDEMKQRAYAVWKKIKPDPVGGVNQVIDIILEAAFASAGEKK